jgi:hypothetical protein
MKDSLLIIERIVIESISKKDKNIYELVNDTKLNQELLQKILPNLLMKNLIRYQRGIYSIEKTMALKWLETINEKQNLKEEVKEMFATLVNNYYQEDQNAIKKNNQLRVQKIWLSPDEDSILRSHLAMIDLFFKNIKNSRERNPVRERTHEQRVIIWGTSMYSDLVEGVLESV